MADNINVTNDNLYLFVPNLIPSAESRLMFNEATQNNYKISSDEYYTERRVINDMIVQHDIGSTQQVNAPKYLICAHQTKERKTVLIKIKIMLNSIILISANIMLKSIQYGIPEIVYL